MYFGSRNIGQVIIEYDSACIKWRQTTGCRSDGAKIPHKDQDCYTHIKDNWSGYCECTGGLIAMEKGCEPGKYKTCNDACIDNDGKHFFLVSTRVILELYALHILY